MVSEFESAAGLRGGHLGPVISGLRQPSWARAGAGPFRARQPGPGPARARQAPAGPEAGGPAGPTAVQVGASLPLPAGPEGWYGEFCLLSLARTGSHAALAVAARWAGQTRRAAGPRPRHPPSCEVAAVDDRGISYRTFCWDMGQHAGRDWWDGHLGLDPAPAPQTRWLEVGPGRQGRRVRIDLTAPSRTVPVVTGPVPPASAATRLLEQAGDDLLGAESAKTGASAQLAGRVRQVIGDLVGAGTLRAGDPAVLQLAGLGWRLGLDLGLGGPVPARALPAAWISVLAEGHARDGPDTVTAFAADLPPVGGARLALAGLRSAHDGATLHVMASGWEARGHGWLVHGTGPGDGPLDLSLSWRARDSTGRWHLVTGMSRGPAGQTGGMIKMYLAPPLHPAATALDVIVTGPDRQICATVPLGRPAGGPRPSGPPLGPLPPGLPPAAEPGR